MAGISAIHRLVRKSNRSCGRSGCRTAFFYTEVRPGAKTRLRGQSDGAHVVSMLHSPH